MSRRSTYVYRLLLRDPRAHRELIRRVAYRHRGVLAAMAWDLDLSRRNVQRHIIVAGAWQDVLAARRLPPHTASDPIATALEEL